MKHIFAPFHARKTTANSSGKLLFILKTQFEHHPFQKVFYELDMDTSFSETSSLDSWMTSQGLSSLPHSQILTATFRTDRQTLDSDHGHADVGAGSGPGLRV